MSCLRLFLNALLISLAGFPGLLSLLEQLFGIRGPVLVYFLDLGFGEMSGDDFCEDLYHCGVGCPVSLCFSSRLEVCIELFSVCGVDRVVTCSCGTGGCQYFLVLITTGK